MGEIACIQDDRYIRRTLDFVLLGGGGVFLVYFCCGIWLLRQRPQTLLSRMPMRGRIYVRYLRMHDWRGVRLVAVYLGIGMRLLSTGIRQSLHLWRKGLRPVACR